MNTSVIKRPVITEKSLQRATESNTYTFAVARTANKHQIAEAVTELFKVDVLVVRTSTGYKKAKRTGRKRLMTSEPITKNALVTLKQGQTIEAFDVLGEAAA